VKPAGSVRRKWVAALLLASLGPLAAFGLTATRVQRRGLERAEQELEAAVVDDVARTLAFELGGASAGTERAATALVDPRVADDETRILLAKGAVVSSERLERVVVYDKDGAAIDAIVAHGKPAPPALPPLAESERVPAPRWTVAVAGGALRARYVTPLGAGGERRGWVAGDLDPQTLSRVVGDASQDRFQRRDRVVLVSSSLQVLAADARAPYAVGGTVEGAALFRGRSSQLTQPLLYTEPFVHGSGQPYVGTVRAVPELGWAVFVERPESEAYGALQDTYRALAIAFTLAAVAAAALGWALGSRAVVPITSLVGLTKRYAAREFSAKNPVTSGDELEELGGAMEAMAKDIAASEAEIARRARIEAGLGRYMPAEVAAALASGDAGSLALEGERRRVAVLFADVAGFTPFAERETPERAIAFLNEVFGVLSEVVFRHGGMVDKYMGDCVMATFGVSGDAARAPAAALACAEDMHRFVEASAAAWAETYGFDARVAIGIAYGDAVLGNLGGELRVEYTAIGDTVNVAARLEGLAGPGKTLVTKELADVGEGFTFESLGPHAVRGRAEPVQIFEVRT
jgi:class 3 adenylate cyclase